MNPFGRGVASGRIKITGSIAEGLATAPEVFAGLLQGLKLGKQLVRLI